MHGGEREGGREEKVNDWLLPDNLSHSVPRAAVRAQT